MAHGRTISPHSSVWPSSEFVADRGPEDPWPQGRLRDDELIGADEDAGVRIADVLTVHVHPPGILCNTEGRVVGGVSGILEPQPAGTDRSRLRERGIRARLRERMATVAGADLNERGVAGDAPLVARAQAELQRRRIGARRVEIGRASCRERVERAGGAGALKKG